MSIRVIRRIFGEPRPQRTMAGFVGDSLATEVAVDVSAVIDRYPGAAFALIAKRADGTVYPAAANMPVTEGTVRYALTGMETALAGDVDLEIQARQGDAVVKSYRVLLTVQDSIGAGGDAPEDPAFGWVDEVLEAAERVMEATETQVFTHAASKWQFYADGSSITIHPAVNSTVQVTADTTGACAINGDAVTLTAGTPYTFAAVAGANTLNANAGSLFVHYNRDSMDLVTKEVFPATSASGSIATLNGCVEGLPLEATLNLVARQTVTQGKNLFDIGKGPVATIKSTVSTIPNGVRITSTEVGVGEFSYAVYALFNYADVAGKQFTLRGELAASASNAGRVYVYWQRENGTISAYIAGLSAIGGKTTFTVGTPPNGEPRIVIIVYANTSAGTVAIGDYVDFTNIQVEEGSVATPYVPFSPQSPSPGDPSPIVGCDSETVYRTGKNQSNPDDMLIQGLDAEGLPVDWKNYITTGFLPLFNGGWGAISWADSTITRATWKIYDATKQLLPSLECSYPGAMFARIVYRHTDAAGGSPQMFTAAELESFRSSYQYELSSTVTEFTPYAGNSYEIENPQTLYGLPGATDEVGVASGVITLRSKYLPLDGTEDWTLAGAYGTSNRFTLAMPDAKPAMEMWCTYAQPLPGGAVNNAVGVFGSTAEGQINLLLPAAVAPDLASFKALLASKASTPLPYAVLYPLAVPTTVAGQTHTIPSLAGTNNLYTDAGGTVAASGYQGTAYLLAQQ